MLLNHAAYSINSDISFMLAAKIYDPNKHCGVVVEEVDTQNGAKITREPCTRSLTCKVSLTSTNNRPQRCSITFKSNHENLLRLHL